MKAHKVCVCGVATHVKSSTIVDHKCPACGLEYPPTVKAAKPLRVATQEEIDRTTGGQGWKPCKACDKYTKGGRSGQCVHCGQTFPKKGKTENPESIEVEDDEIVEVEENYVHRAYLPPPEIQFDIEGYNIPDNVRAIYEFPYGTTVVNFAEAKPAFKMEGNLTNVEVLRWANDLRKHMLGFHRQWLTSGCLYSILAQQFKGQPELEWIKTLLAKMPDVNRSKMMV
jgi:hypothetical protein